MKVKLSTLIKELEHCIKEKHRTGNSQYPIDNEVMAFISLYRHGSAECHDMAKEWLIAFLIDADFVKGKRSILS